MHKDKKDYIIVKDRHPRISEVKNDCVNLCVPASKGESLALILQKICSKFTNRDTQLTELIETLQTEIELLETQGVDYQEQIDDLQEQIDNLESSTAVSGEWSPFFTDQPGQIIGAIPISDFSAPASFTYIRIGNIVSFSGWVGVTTAASAGFRSFSFTLPEDHPRSGTLAGTISVDGIPSGSAFFGGVYEFVGNEGAVQVNYGSSTTANILITGQYIVN
jgi:hypothetical protein